MTYEELGELAKQIIIKVMQEGEKKHPLNDFMERSYIKHHTRACKHMDMILALPQIEHKEELAHAMTRIAIMLAKLQQIR